MTAKKSTPTVSPPLEKRAFKMHPKLLWDVITRQAGTLSKAGLELVMNTIDSGSTKCDITITPTRLTVSDDGKGFVGREEIEKFFETFGHPHEEGDATYGRFRMGRGQAFAFGRNRWKSNEFNMLVDIKPQEKAVASDGLFYDLATMAKPVKGCQIEIDLYDKLLPSQVDAMVREMTAYVKFAQIPVTINGTVVNTIPKDKKWGMETDDAYFDLKDSSTLSVYSIGVLVRSYPSSQFGTGGTIVSKEALSVNFARNDVQSSCKIFKRIASAVRKTAVKESVKRKRLTDAEWEAVSNDVRNGDTPIAEIFSTPLVKLVTGSMISLADLASRISKHHERIASAAPDDHMADRIMQRGVALVLDNETIERFGYGSLKEFCAGISKLAKKSSEKMQKSGEWQIQWKMNSLASSLAEVKILTSKDFGKHVKADYDDVPLKELNPAEKFAFEIISYAVHSIGRDIQCMVQAVREDDCYGHKQFTEKFSMASCQRMESLCGKNAVPLPRELKVGASSSAQAWTDGEAVIWLNRRHLKLVSSGIPGMVRLAQLIFHEYIHQSPSTGDLNVHNMEFYQAHHDISIDTPLIGRAVGEMMDRSIRLVRQEKRKPTGALQKFEDQISELTGKIITPAEPESQVSEIEEVPEEMSMAARGPAM